MEHRVSPQADSDGTIFWKCRCGAEFGFPATAIFHLQDEGAKRDDETDRASEEASYAKEFIRATGEAFGSGFKEGLTKAGAIRPDGKREYTYDVVDSFGGVEANQVGGEAIETAIRLTWEVEPADYSFVKRYSFEEASASEDDVNPFISPEYVERLKAEAGSLNGETVQRLRDEEAADVFVGNAAQVSGRIVEIINEAVSAAEEEAVASEPTAERGEPS